MPIKDAKKYREYMKRYMRDYRAQERELIHHAKTTLNIPLDRRKIEASGQNKTLDEFQETR